MKTKIMAGIMSVCLMGGIGIIPETVAPAVSMAADAETEETIEIVNSGKWGKSGTWSLDADS